VSGRLVDKVCLVTGAAGGIGGAVVQAYLQEGARVAAADLPGRKPVGPVFDQERLGWFGFDATHESSVDEMVTAVERAHRRIDVLVNCAGITQRRRFVDLSVAEWDRMLAVNLRGTFLVTHSVVPLMLRARRGRIINVASQLGQIGGALLTHYSASKAGIIGFTKALARELAPEILVNAIAPGPVLTDMIRDRETEWFDAIKAQLPMGRVGNPEEVAPTAVFLASSDGDLYTGQTLGPNSGHVML